MEKDMCRITMDRSITHRTRTKQARRRTNVNIVPVSNPADHNLWHLYRNVGSYTIYLEARDLLPTTLSPTTCRTAKLASLSCFTFVTQSSRTYMEIVRQTLNLVLKTYSFPRNEGDLSTAALDAACDENGGKCPDAVFLCAGSARPGFFIEENEASLRQDMDQCYWVQAWSALAASKRTARGRSLGKIVFVSSVLGFTSMVGYASYAPGKHALRGLAETLRFELLLDSASVHIFSPGTIYSPEFLEENKTKPKITLKIEEAGVGVKPEEAVEALLKAGHFHTSGDSLEILFRSSTWGSSPQNNVLMPSTASLVGGHWTEHDEYLAHKGFFNL